MPRSARCCTSRGSVHCGKLPRRPERAGRCSTWVRQVRRISGAERSARSSGARPARIRPVLPAPSTRPAHLPPLVSGIGPGGWGTIVAMPTDRPTEPPQALTEEIAALRADLAAGCYTTATIEQLLGPVATGALRRENAVPARRVLAGREEPAAVLLSLFTLGAVVPRAQVQAVLPTLGADAPPSEAPLRARVDLAPYAASADGGQIDWWIASDLSELATGRPLGPEHVLGVGGASLTLAKLAPRRSVGRVLDLGCGGGIQA